MTTTEEQGPIPDPVETSSMSKSMLVWSFGLLAVTFWATWDEFITKRPWKSYQSEFVAVYGKYLETVLQEQKKKEAGAKQDEEAAGLQAEMTTEAKRIYDRKQAIINRIIQVIEPNIKALTATMKFPKAAIDVANYERDHAQDAAREDWNEKIKSMTAVKRAVVLRNEAGKEGDSLSLDFTELESKWAAFKDEKAQLVRAQGRLEAKFTELKARYQARIEFLMDGLNPAKIQGLQASLDNFKIMIRQIHVADVHLIDRCESCHVGILEPVAITDEGLRQAGLDGDDNASLRKVFLSHPRPGITDTAPDLLKIHEPERFGCSPCHGGNGIGTINTFLAHGKNHHWLWPLYDRENTEAGCNQCHEESLVLDGAPTLNAGKELFRSKGCWGCHKRVTFDGELTRLQKLRITVENLNREDIEKKREIIAIDKLRDALPDNAVDEDYEKLNRLQNAVIVERSGLETSLDQRRKEQKMLLAQRKKVGPNLKEIRAKLKRDWIPFWLENNKAFRPTTKMPQQRMPEKHRRAIAAFIWQSAIDPNTPGLDFKRNVPVGDATKGKELFRQRGCMACHSIDGEGANFGADLSRVGEKINFDYLVRWIYDPRQRLLPYSSAAKRDITPKDYQDNGRAFLFDDEHSLCPVTGEELLVKNMTVMPVLRLTWEEARNVASYLIAKVEKSDYPDASWMEDEGLSAEGRDLVKHYGCMGCHEIAGLEDEGLIGTELTRWGSKPIDRIDFGLITSQYKHEHKYNHKGFAMKKLEQPEFWDKGKQKNALQKLRMPSYDFSEKERVELTTFLLGSVDSRMPQRFFRNPQGPDKAIADGWWIVKKYNCIGCHEIIPGQKPSIQSMPEFGGEKVVDAPPSLAGQGFRTNPAWLAKFLKNPPLVHRTAKTGTDQTSDRWFSNGVRVYLNVRMPSFSLTDEEIGKLVAFFDALSQQPTPYVPERYEPMTAAEKTLAKQVMDLACLKCHFDQEITEFTIAPSFQISGERLKPRWFARWLTDPAKLIPGTKMPTGLFNWNEQERRWTTSVTGLETELGNYRKDHRDLIVRYLIEFGK